ncbi:MULTISPECIES: sigma-70 family RNA polymerase sigma factor [unclassified Paenibacillus]|uniref:sigma-70 family RNA polymerase sigma factor n=1 Tax=unclassified Paenibacillus TaxID=185978 RepID=UPI003640B413
MTEDELHEWIGKVNQGNKEAFRVLYEQSKEHVYHTVSFLVSNKNDVCDVVSEVYVQLFKALPGYNFQKPYRSWLNGLIIRQTRSWNRKLWRRFRIINRSKLLEPLEPAPEDMEQIHLRNEQGNELAELVQKLSYKHSEVIVLRYFQDCSFEEISELLGIPLNTAKSRHRVALEKLRKQAKNVMKENEEALLYVHRKST